MNNLIYCTRAFLLGVRDFRHGLTANPGPLQFEAYDAGRAFAHFLTFHIYDF